MCQVNVYEAKTHLSKYLNLLKSGDEEEIVICNNGVPCAKITSVKPLKTNGIVFGLASKYITNYDINHIDQEIENDFNKEIDAEW